MSRGLKCNTSFDWLFGKNQLFSIVCNLPVPDPGSARYCNRYDRECCPDRAPSLLDPTFNQEPIINLKINKLDKVNHQVNEH